MPSLFIKDADATQKVKAMAKRLGTTQTETVRRGMAALEEKLGAPISVELTFMEKMKEYRRLNPLPPLAGKAPDKAFYDWLSGEEDVHDPFR